MDFLSLIRPRATDKIQLRGTWVAELRDGKTGRLKERWVHDNLVVNTGKNRIFSRLDSNTDLAIGSGNANTRMAVGSTGTAPAVTDTALLASPGTLTGTVRKALDAPPTLGSQQIVYVSTFATSDAVGSIAEAGMFDATSGGVMLNRVVYSPVITKSGSDTLALTYVISL